MTAGGVLTSSRDTVAIVTGGSRGIGRELARELAGRAYAIVVVYLDDQSSAEAIVEEIIGAHGAAVAVRADIADELDVERLFAETIAAFGGVDVVAHTTVRGGAVLYQHAARQLRRGAAIVSASTTEAITPVLAEDLQEHGITVNGVPPGLEPAGAGHDLADLVGLLDRWRDG